MDDERQTTDPLGSRSHSPPSAPRSSLPSIFLLHSVPDIRSLPAAFIAASRLTYPASSKQSGCRSTAIGCNTFGVTNRMYLSRKMIFPVTLLPKTAPASGTIRGPNKNLPTKQSAHPPKNGQARRQSIEPPESNTRVCLGFVSKTFFFQKLL